MLGFTVAAGLALGLSAPTVTHAAITDYDTVAPVFSGVESKEINLSDVSSFDPNVGVTATDDKDGAVTYVIKGRVSAKGGVYKLKYSASDKSGNETLVTRTIAVVDNVGPEFKGVTSGAAISVGLSKAAQYDPKRGVSAIDSTDGRVNYTVTGTVEAEVGDYELTYRATDKAGEITELTVTVTVYDNVKPVFAGIPTYTNLKLSEVTADNYEFDAKTGVTVSDSTDTTAPTFTVTGEVGTTVGTYRLTYTAVDEAGNIATVVRKVKVVDDIKPVFYSNSNSSTDIVEITTFAPETISVADAKTFNSKKGIIAIDNVDGDRSYSVRGRVKAAAGTYKLTYTVTDRARNATTLTRTITVQ